MTDVPKMIALRWQPGAAVTSGPLMDHPDYTRYVRQDMTHPIEQAADAVDREIADLRAKLAVAVEALGEISKQKKTTEIKTEYNVDSEYFEYGYDACIDLTRAAPAQIKVDE